MSLIIEKLSPENDAHRNFVYGDVQKFKVDFYKNYYPNVKSWYRNIFLKGFENGTRIVRVVRDGDNLYGLSIIRVDARKKQNKLCTLFLLTEARKNGIGTHLVNQTLNDCFRAKINKPTILTISEERLKENINGKNLLDFFKDYEFKLVSIDRNRYRLGKDEYICRKVVHTQPLLNILPTIKNINSSPVITVQQYL